MAQPHTVPCAICGKTHARRNSVPAAAVRPSLAQRIEARHPDRWSPDGWICVSCLNAERTAHVVDELERERGELSDVEREISRRASEHVTIAARLDEQFGRGLSLGQRAADAMARVGGSWTFVGIFAGALVSWIVLNSVLLVREPFDPFPYILLNLMLSCLAAIQAPIIMMSQNRTAARDRMEADLDYKINLKAELEVAALHEKLDHLLHVQWERMVELQQTQLDMLEELARGRTRP